MGAWFFVRLIIPSFMMAFDIFFLSLRTILGLPHPMGYGFSQCICNQAIDSIGIHLFSYVHVGERTTTQDAVQDSFTSIVKEVKFHVLH